MSSIATSSSRAAASDLEVLRRPTTSNVSWGAILAGVSGALVAQVILSLLGLGLGLATIDPTQDGTPSASAFSIGAGIRWIVSGVMASALGGFLAGQLSGHRRTVAGYHGLVSWAVSTLVVAFLLSSAAGSILSGAVGTASSILGGAGQAVGGAVQLAGRGAAPALQNGADPLSAILDQVKTATGDQDPAALRADAANALRSALTGDGANQQQALDHAAEALAKARNIPVDQAKQQISQLRTQYDQTVAAAKQKAEVVAEKAAQASSYTAFVAAIALLLGAVAAFIGGRVGETETAL